MATHCTASASSKSCSHYQVQLLHEGQTITLHTSQAEIDALTLDEHDLRRFHLYNLKLAQAASGRSIGQLAGLAVRGEEPTRLRQFLILSKDVTKTNMGGAAATTYAVIPNGANGERVTVDFTGFTQFRVVCNFALIGTGIHRFRLLDHVTQANVLYESADISTAGEKEIEGAWTTLPAWATGEKKIFAQCRSTVNADDPVYRRIVLELK